MIDFIAFGDTSTYKNNAHPMQPNSAFESGRAKERRAAQRER
jgi:hypothetical protein